MEIDSKIVSFIGRHHVMTLATSGGPIPYCSSIFYSWMGESECFVFASSQSTRHGKDALAQSSVAGSITLESKIIGKLQGLQFQGEMTLCSEIDSDFAKSARRSYLKQFPYAIAIPDLELWVLKPHFLKYTDNTLGFGKKLIWGDEKF